jgi:hypothetical protein
MCERCTEIEKKIAHSLPFSLDQLTLDRIEMLIADLHALKERLHPTQE